MPRVPNPPKRQILVRLLEARAQELEVKAKEQSYDSLPAFIADQLGAETFVYRLFDEADALLYVGVTGDPDGRFKAHSRTKAWWHEVARMDVEKYDSRLEALSAEARTIFEESPRYNSSHGGGRPKSDDPTVAVQFRMKRSAYQWWHKRADEAGIKLHKLLQQVTENRAAREGSRPNNKQKGS